MYSRTYLMTPLSDLPDPAYQPEFYDSVPYKRLMAWVVDAVVILGLVLIALMFTTVVGLFLLPILFVTLGFAYRVVTLANGSATLGMRLAAIEMRQINGQRFDLATAFWHTLGYSVSISIAPLQLVSIVLMLTTSHGQGLTDHVLGTTALNRRR